MRARPIRKPRTQPKPNAGEDLLEFHLTAHKVAYLREYRFAAEHVGMGTGIRQRLLAAGLQDWRSDFAIPSAKLLIEVEGGGWTGGRHTRGGGFEEDLRKYGEAMRLGWNVYRCSPGMVKAGKAINTILDLLEITGESEA